MLKGFSRIIVGIVILGVGIILTNCTGHLNRSKAAGLISEYPKFSEVLTGDVRLGEVYVMGVLGDDQRIYEALKAAGYLQVANQANPLMHSANLTEKGKKAAAEWETGSGLAGKFYKVPYAKREIVEVTGISEPKEGGNTAQAKFTWRLVPLNDIGKAMSLDTKNVEGDAVLQKFDDGWRVVNIFGPGLEPAVRIF
jgi:hypothetical protein